MDLELKGRLAFISGSSRGIGKGIAETLLEEGCSVAINGRNTDELKKTCKELGGGFGNNNVFSLAEDITLPGAAKSALASVTQMAGKTPDIVVPNVGSGRSEPGWDVTDEEWERMFLLNFFGAVKLAREAVRTMEQTGGDIVFIASIAGMEAIPAPLSYSSAKAALLSYMKNLSETVAPMGIRANAVSPGNVYFEGGTWDGKLKETRDKAMEYINRAVPLKDFVSPRDVGNAVAFLLSRAGRFITGHNMVVDGGQVRKII